MNGPLNQPSLPPHHDMPFLEHLRELRTRLFVSLVAVLAGAVVAFMYSNQLFEITAQPLRAAFQAGEIIGTGPADAFMLKLKLAIFGGLILASPVVFHQLWLFIAPGLLPNERRYVLPFVFCSCALFLLGIWFCYISFFPVVFGFFADEYTSIGVKPSIRITEHLSFFLSILTVFGVIFEMPVLAFFLARLGLVDAKMLWGAARYAILIIFILAAVLTPPDAVSQLLMAIPMTGLYLVSIGVAWLAAPKEISDSPS